jgi:hypothetical protein
VLIVSVVTSLRVVQPWLIVIRGVWQTFHLFLSQTDSMFSLHFVKKSDVIVSRFANDEWRVADELFPGFGGRHLLLFTRTFDVVVRVVGCCKCCCVAVLSDDVSSFLYDDSDVIHSDTPNSDW